EGKGHQKFIGRFNIETFIVAQPPGGQAAPIVHDQPPFPDAETNPATEPIHTFHLGLWFNSPTDAVHAGCPGAVTRFNGDHNAGTQVLSTQNFPNPEGPLKQLTPYRADRRECSLFLASIGEHSRSRAVLLAVQGFFSRMSS